MSGASTKLTTKSFPKRKVGDLRPLTELRELVKQPAEATKTVRSLDPRELAALYADFGSQADIAVHIGISDTLAGRLMREAGIRGVVGAIDLCVKYYPEVQIPTVAQAKPADDYKALAEVYKRTNADLHNELKKWYGVYGIVEDIIRARVPTLPAVVPRYKTPTATKVDPELVEIHVSDVHVGEWVLTEDTAGLSTYSWDVFLERKQRLIEGIDSIVVKHIRRSYPTPNALVLLYGDMGTGENIFSSQAFRIDRFLLEQIVDGAHEIADLIRYICSIFERVIVYAVPGNHGRVEGTTLNTDLLMYMQMKRELSEQKNLLEFAISGSPFLAYFLDESVGLLDYSKGGRRWEHVMCHGSEVRRYYKTPYYGADTLHAQLSSLFKIPWDRMATGHHHVFGEAERWMFVPSWLGATSYSVGRLQQASRPTQLINGFHPRKGMTWHYKIYLDDEPRAEEPQDGSNIYTPELAVAKAGGTDRPAERGRSGG